MSIIANLAVKISANISDLTKNVSDVTASLDNIAKAAAKTTPSIKNMEDAMKGLDVMSKSLAEVQGKIGTEWLDGFVDDQVNVMDKLDSAIDKIKGNFNSMAQGAADDILKMKPTTENIIEAQKRVTQLKEVAAELATRGIDISEAIAQAEQNASGLANQVIETQVGMESFKAVLFSINAVPFMVLSNVLTDLIGGMKNFGTEFNERFNGVPGKILQVIAVLSSLIIVLGLAHAKMATLGVSTTYFTSLLKSSLVYQGFAGFVALIPVAAAGIWTAAAATAAWLAAQLGLNTAWTYFLASTGIGLILLAIGGIVYGIIKLVQWLTSGSSAAEQMKETIKATEEQTAAFRDRIGESIDRYKELNNLARKYHEDNLTDLQKYENKLKEIDEVMNRQNVADAVMNQLNAKQKELQAILDQATNQDQIDSLQKQIDNIVADKAALQKERDQSPAMSAADAAAAKEKERAALLHGRFGNLLEQTLTPQQKYAQTMADLAELTQRGLVTEAERQQIAANALKRFNETDASVLAAKKKADELASAQQKLIDRFKGMQTLPPVAAFDAFSAELRSVRAKLKPEEFAAAQQKLLDDLANGLGIADFVNPQQRETLESVQQKVLDYYNKLDSLGKATFDLAAAQQRVTESFEKQAENYALYQKAQDALIPAQQKLADALAGIEADAAKFNWNDAAVEKMKEMITEEIMGKNEQEQDASPKTSPTDHSRNAALEMGTVAYYEAQRKGNDPILKENQKQTKTLETIAKNTAAHFSNDIQFTILG